MEIKIDQTNVGYYSIYRDPEVAYIELDNNIPSFTKSEIERGLLEEPLEEYHAVDESGFGVAFVRIDNIKPTNRKKSHKPIILSV